MTGALAPPTTKTMLSHAITIRARGVTIGAISEWNPRHTRTITELYELADGTSGGYDPGVGVPYEKVPGNTSGQQIDVRRYDLYTGRMEQQFGSADMSMLSDQMVAFEVTEQWIKPNNDGQLIVLYSGCWFSDIGRTIQSTGDRVINVSATLQWTRRRYGSAV